MFENADALKKLLTKEKLNFFDKDELSSLDRDYENLSKLANDPKSFDYHNHKTSVFSDIYKLPLNERAEAVEKAVSKMEKNVNKIIKNEKSLEKFFKKEGGDKYFARVMRQIDKIEKTGVGKFFDDKFDKPLKKIQGKQKSTSNIDKDSGVNPIFSGKQVQDNQKVMNLGKGR